MDDLSACTVWFQSIFTIVINLRPWLALLVKIFLFIFYFLIFWRSSHLNRGIVFRTALFNDTGLAVLRIFFLYYSNRFFDNQLAPSSFVFIIWVVLVDFDIFDFHWKRESTSSSFWVDLGFYTSTKLIADLFANWKSKPIAWYFLLWSLFGYHWKWFKKFTQVTCL